MYQLLVPDAVKKQLRKLDPRYKRAVSGALDRLCEIPTTLGEPLKGEFKGLFRLRVANYRIVYQINHQRRVVLLITIEHRKDVYR